MQQETDPGDRANTTNLEPTAPQEMPALVESFDWSTTPLGPAAAWPDSLKAVVRILLTSRFPMWMAWGPDLTFLYNDAYRRTTLGKKHPWALGKPAQQVWHEIWKDIGPLIRKVMETGEASWDETLLLILERSGYPEETYHTFSYSPLSDSDGGIVGMLCVVMEDTVRVIGERQLASLSTLAEALAGAISGQGQSKSTWARRFSSAPRRRRRRSRRGCMMRCSGCSAPAISSQFAPRMRRIFDGQRQRPLDPAHQIFSRIPRLSL